MDSFTKTILKAAAEEGSPEAKKALKKHKVKKGFAIGGACLAGAGAITAGVMIYKHHKDAEYCSLETSEFHNSFD